MLRDTITTSQGAESQMRASIRNSIRSAEPQQMLLTVLTVQRRRFYERKARAIACSSPVPPNVETHIAQLVCKAQRYIPSVVFIPGTDYMEATVVSYRDATQTRRVIFTAEEYIPPACCAYSRCGDGFPCLHGVAVICKKHGANSIYKYVARRHLSSSWKAQYENVDFRLPSQLEIDQVMDEARKKVARGEALQVPVALPPPRGRPPKNASKRLKAWYERGSSHSKRRKYACGLCGKPGHRMTSCSLKQTFEEELSDLRSDHPRTSEDNNDDTP